MGCKLHLLPHSLHRLSCQRDEHHQRLEGAGEPGECQHLHQLIMQPICQHCKWIRFCPLFYLYILCWLLVHRSETTSACCRVSRTLHTSLGLRTRPHCGRGGWPSWTTICTISTRSRGDGSTLSPSLATELCPGSRPGSRGLTLTSGDPPSLSLSLTHCT